MCLSFQFLPTTIWIFSYLQDTHQYMVIPFWVCTSQIPELPYLLTVLIKFAITMLYICFAIYDEFKFISLLYAEWANRTLIWLLENLHSMFIFPKTTAKPIRIICIYIQQSTMSLLSFDQYSLRQPVFFFLHIIAWIVACPKILDSLHIYVINHVVTYNNITDVVGTSGQSTVTWGVRASGWKTRVLPVFKCQLNEEIGQWLIIFNCGNLTLRCK